MNNQVKKMVKNFLDEVKEKLPGWLKENEVELDDVLTQLEEHVYEKATELARSEDIDINSMRQAIFEMGKPEDIAREYKRRGTPKVFITEELRRHHGNTGKGLSDIPGHFSDSRGHRACMHPFRCRSAGPRTGHIQPAHRRNRQSHWFKNRSGD